MSSQISKKHSFISENISLELKFPLKMMLIVVCGGNVSLSLRLPRNVNYIMWNLDTLETCVKRVSL